MFNTVKNRSQYANDRRLSIIKQMNALPCKCPLVQDEDEPLEELSDDVGDASSRGEIITAAVERIETERTEMRRKYKSRIVSGIAGLMGSACATAYLLELKNGEPLIVHGIMAIIVVTLMSTRAIGSGILRHREESAEHRKRLIKVFDVMDASDRFDVRMLLPDRLYTEMETLHLEADAQLQE